MANTYTALAPLYDRIMAHVEYDRWASYVNAIIAKYVEVRSPRLLELGGGTGILGEKLQETGVRYFGSDFSPSMCNVAAKRALPFFAADARLLPIKKSAKFDMVIFLYDAINYLGTLDEYRTVFSQIHACLKPGGFFLFDVTTLENSLTNFSDYLDSEDLGDACFIRRSFFNPQDSLQYNDFTIFHKENSGQEVYHKYTELHIQKVFAINELQDAIPPKLFDIVGKWDNYSFKRCSSRSERVHFLLRKKCR
jgi:SAM-dependent methyltransferase